VAQFWTGLDIALWLALRYGTVGCVASVRQLLAKYAPEILRISVAAGAGVAQLGPGLQVAVFVAALVGAAIASVAAVVALRRLLRDPPE
jgi:hypothetical protein